MSKLVVNANDKKSIINKNIYGHFAEHLGRCIYEGLFVGKDSAIPNTGGMRNDVVAALKNIAVPVLRWPGGCFADTYHWKDGIGPLESRKKIVNSHWGGVVEDNSFGTHEFLELCEQIGCEPYISVNLGSGTVQEMNEWIEYMLFPGMSPMAELRKQNGREEPWNVKYIGVGNENWGCGGCMRPEYYADIYRHYQTYARGYDRNNRLFRIACGPAGADYNWTEVMMPVAGRYMDGFALHHYTMPFKNRSEHIRYDALNCTNEEYFFTLDDAMKMEELIKNHTGIMDRHDPDKKVGLIVDEWGTWFNVEPGTNPRFLYQQSTMRDAIVAAMTLNIFNTHSDRVIMANIAQTVNVLQAVILTEGDKMILTPTYHVFDLYKRHQDATLIYSHVEMEKIGVEGAMLPNLHVSASQSGDGVINITLANLDPNNAYPIELNLSGKKLGKLSARILCGDKNDHNDFSHPNDVAIRAFSDFKTLEDGLVSFTMPACGVMEITAD